MTHPLDCPIFHEFDGQCCAKGEPCLCRRERVTDPKLRDILLAHQYWAVLGAAVLLPVLACGFALADKFSP